MPRLILVHGSFHGAWCWEPVLSHLHTLGLQAVALDLPGRGTSPAEIRDRTLSTYVGRVAAELEASPQPVVLVGHSMGGGVVGQAAERMPERILRTVYVCAFLPRSGQRLLDLATTDAASAILPALVIDEPAGVHWVQPEARPAVFYNDCTEQVARAASAGLIPEALAQVATPVHLNVERFGREPRTYVRTLRDACLTPELQDRMRAATPCERVIDMDTDHSPFLARPEELAGILAGEGGG